MSSLKQCESQRLATARFSNVFWMESVNKVRTDLKRMLSATCKTTEERMVIQ